MLVLGRTLGQRISLELPDGRIIWISVEVIDRKKIRLGIDAPGDIKVFREELLDTPKRPG